MKAEVRAILGEIMTLETASNFSYFGRGPLQKNPFANLRVHAMIKGKRKHLYRRLSNMHYSVDNKKSDT